MLHQSPVYSAFKSPTETNPVTVYKCRRVRISRTNIFPNVLFFRIYLFLAQFLSNPKTVGLTSGIESVAFGRNQQKQISLGVCFCNAHQYSIIIITIIIPTVLHYVRHSERIWSCATQISFGLTDWLRTYIQYLHWNSSQVAWNKEINQHETTTKIGRRVWHLQLDIDDVAVSCLAMLEWA